MTNASIMEMAESLFKLNLVMMGKLHAMEVIHDTLLVTLCKSAPPFAEVIEENLHLLAAESRKNLPSNIVAEFNSSIDGFHGSIQFSRQQLGETLRSGPD